MERRKLDGQDDESMETEAGDAYEAGGDEEDGDADAEGQKEGGRGESVSDAESEPGELGGDDVDDEEGQSKEVSGEGVSAVEGEPKEVDGEGVSAEKVEPEEVDREGVDDEGGEPKDDDGEGMRHTEDGREITGDDEGYGRGGEPGADGSFDPGDEESGPDGHGDDVGPPGREARPEETEEGSTPPSADEGGGGRGEIPDAVEATTARPGSRGAPLAPLVSGSHGFEPPAASELSARMEASEAAARGRPTGRDSRDGAAEADVPGRVRKYDRFKKVDRAEYDRVNEFLRKRTYLTAREWAIARLCADFRTETGVEMTLVGENLPDLVPFMEDTYSPQAVNQARSAFVDKVRMSGSTFLYGAMSGFFTTEELDEMMYEVSETARFLLEVEGAEVDVEHETSVEDRISEAMRDIRESSRELRRREGDDECPHCGEPL